VRRGERIQIANLDDRFLNRAATEYIVHRCLALNRHVQVRRRARREWNEASRLLPLLHSFPWPSNGLGCTNHSLSLFRTWP
jgi:hypothetical protein